MTPDLLARADHGCVLLQAAYAWQLDCRPGVRLASICNAFGIQARLIVDSDDNPILVVPGTGYAEQGAPDERVKDWLFNLRSGLSASRLGQSGRYRWPRGFLDVADLLDDWLRANLDGSLGFRQVAYAYGHSQGAAALQILAWSNQELFGEAHCIASPYACFSSSAPSCPCIHVWQGIDDPVCHVPWVAIPGLWMRGRHVGQVHPLPRNRFRHRVFSYRERLAMLRSSVAKALA